ncbi:hypothetical protein [Candidatus Lokiarchaeum ossiferum]|uniref:hypothetical protein n=1 Tax=Candidatus Lokiarchaeum ossiferum TaxID=2951803 RepID=UPI00352EF667
MSINISGKGIAIFENFVVKATFVSLNNSYLLMVTDQEQFGIGTVTLSSPPTEFGTKATSSPFNIFGMKNSMLSNAIGRNASKHLKKPVLSLVLLVEKDFKQEIIIKTTMEAVNKAIEDVISKGNNKT